MSRIDDVLELENLDTEARKELQNGKEALKDLEALASVASSNGGTVLLEILKETARDTLLKMITAKTAGETEKIMPLLADFEANFTLYNTIKSAAQDYESAEEQLNDRIDEIIEGTSL